MNEITEQEAEAMAKSLSDWLNKNGHKLRTSETQRVKWKELLFTPHRAFHGLIAAVK